MEAVTWVGIDWGEGKHSFVIKGSKWEGRGEIGTGPEVVHEWAQELIAKCQGTRIVVALEQSRGALIYALQRYESFEIVPVNPRAASAYRQALYLSGAKDDPVDAELLCEFVKAHPQLRRWQPDDVTTRKLRLLVEGRRRLVEQRTSTVQALTAALKQYFPQALAWFHGCDGKLARAFVMRWPTLSAAAAARREAITNVIRVNSRMKPERIEELVSSIRSTVPLTTDAAIIEPLSLLVVSYVRLLDALDTSIRSHDEKITSIWTEHPDRELFASFPGAGAVMAPRLAVAFGVDRDRFASAAQIQQYSGIAPVIERSGKQSWTHARFRCPKFLRQTFHEFAAASLPFSDWARAYYHQQRTRGAGHHAAVRSLAFRWIRILFHCWKTNTFYDEQHHIDTLRRRNSPIAARLAA